MYRQRFDTLEKADKELSATHAETLKELAALKATLEESEASNAALTEAKAALEGEVASLNETIAAEAGEIETLRRDLELTTRERENVAKEKEQALHDLAVSTTCPRHIPPRPSWDTRAHSINFKSSRMF